MSTQHRCAAFHRLREDRSSAVEGFERQAATFEERGDVSRSTGMRAQALGARRAMARVLNSHLTHCKECS